MKTDLNLTCGEEQACFLIIILTNNYLLAGLTVSVAAAPCLPKLNVSGTLLPAGDTLM